MSHREKQIDPSQAKEIRLRGLVASPGIALGRCFKHDNAPHMITKQHINSDQVDAEIERLNHAIAEARKELEQIQTEADNSIGSQLAKIFEAQLLILDDKTFFEAVCSDIGKSRLNAEYVYNRHLQRTLTSLRKSEDNYLREMANDINATAAKVFNYLIGHHVNKLVNNKGKIALAEDFSPGEVVLMGKYGIPGFATSLGGQTSHMTLIAKSLSIPGVVGVSRLLEKVPDNAEVIIDGENGWVIINPEKTTLEEFKDEQKRRKTAIARQLRGISKIPSHTLDGREISVMANLEIPTAVDEILAGNKVGVGLYRTEFFYLTRMKFPTEDEQAVIYSNIARTFFPNHVTLRVYDLGSDKVISDYRDAEELNPALGWRGIRLDLDMPDVFKTQVRAILRASKNKNVKIMLPMVSTAMELIRAKRIIHGSMKELESEGVAFDENIDIGIMIEVPSAALMANELARHVCFFSIGTNDLVQYTLAADRGNKKVAGLYRELHPAVLKLIKMTIEAGETNKVVVTLCGEMGSRNEAIPLLVGMGLNGFSVVPPRVARIKKLIASLDYSECRRLADRVLSLATTEKVEAVLHNWMEAHVSKELLED
ncbi:MAG: phosphoenolpyruvate--protein phosphotransferase [Candidatus Zixiibacteriota bacterium]